MKQLMQTGLRSEKMVKNKISKMDVYLSIKQINAAS